MHSFIIEELKFLKYAEICEIAGHAYFKNYPTVEPEGTGFVYLWVEIDGESKAIVYIGKAGKKMVTRCSQHVGGFTGASKSKAGLRHSKRICDGIKLGKSYHVYYRKAEVMNVFNESISIHSAEEEALIKKLKEGHNHPLWNS